MGSLSSMKRPGDELTNLLVPKRKRENSLPIITDSNNMVKAGLLDQLCPEP